MIEYIEIIIILIITAGIIYMYMKKFGKLSEKFIDTNNNNYPVINDGIIPLVLKNNEALPTIPILTKPLGSVGYFISKILRKFVYPVDPIIEQTTNIDILNTLKYDQLAIIREYELLKLPPEEQTKLRILTPLPFEWLICMTRNDSPLYNIVDIMKPGQNGAKYMVGVLKDSVALFNIICKNRNIKRNQQSSSFIIVDQYEQESELFTDMGLGKLDMIFIVTHPKSTALQTYCETNVVRLVDIYPSGVDDINPERVYNPDDSKPVDIFMDGIRRDIPWVFTDSLSVDKLPNTRLSVIKGGQRDTKNISIARYQYKTFKLRTLLVYKYGGMILRETPNISSQMAGLVNRLLREYENMSYALNNWNKIVGDSTADNIDSDSLKYDELASLPKELILSSTMKQILSQTGLIKTDTIVSCTVST